MAKGVTTQFTVGLNITADVAEQAVRSAVNKLNKMLADIDTTADKMKYFEELVGYIGELDKAMTALRNKNGSTFDKVFSGLDSSLRSELEKIFGIAESKIKELNNLRVEIDTTKIDGANLETLEKWEKSIQSIYNIMGKKADVDGLGTIEERIQKAKAAVDNFGLVWSDTLATMSKGFTGGGAQRGADVITAEIDALELQYKRLNEIKTQISKAMSDVDKFNEGESLFGDQVKFTPNDIINELNEFKSAYQALSKFKGKKTSDEYYDILSRYLQQAAKFSEMYGLLVDNPNTANAKMFDKIKDKQFGNRSLGDRMAGMFEQAEEALIGKLPESLSKFQGNLDSQISEIDTKLQGLQAELTQLNAIKSEALAGSAGATFGDQITQIGKGVADTSKYIQNMTASLQEMFGVLSQAKDAEYKILIDGPEMSVKRGGNEETLQETAIEAYLANLHKDIDVDAHSHQGLGANIDADDLREAIRRQYGGLTKLSAIVGPKDIVTLDLANVQLEDAYTAVSKLEEKVKGLAKKNQSISVDDLNKIFTEINPEYTGVAQKWNPSKFGDLAQYIYDVKDSAAQALTPLDRFKNILTTVTDNKIDLSKYDDLLKTFSPDKAGSIFSQIMKSEGRSLQVNDVATGSIDDVVKDIQRQKDAFVDLRQSAGITYGEIKKAAQDYLAIYNKKEGKSFDFFQKYFHPSEMQDIQNMFIDIGSGFRDLEGVSKQLAFEFGLDPEDIASFDQAGNAAKDAAEKLKQLYILTDLIDRKGTSPEMTDIDIGRYTELLNIAEQELKSLGEQGALTSEQLTQANKAIDVSKGTLSEATKRNEQRREEEVSGKYDYTYAAELSAEERKNEELRKTNEQLRKENENLKVQASKDAQRLDGVGKQVEEKAAKQATSALDKKIKEAENRIKISENWIDYLDTALDDDKFKSKGKKEATEKLRRATSRLVDGRAGGFEHETFHDVAEARATVAWVKAYKEAEKQGVAQSTLDKNFTNAEEDYDKSLHILQDMYARKQQLLAADKALLKTLQEKNTEDSQRLNLANEELKVKQAVTEEQQKQQPDKPKETAKEQTDAIKQKDNAADIAKETEAHQAKTAAIREEATAQKELATAEKTTQNIEDKKDVADSADETRMQNLLGMVNQVTSAVEAKTTALTQYLSTIDSVVQKETESLGELSKLLTTFQQTTSEIFKADLVPSDAFAAWKTDIEAISNSAKTIIDAVSQIRALSGQTDMSKVDPSKAVDTAVQSIDFSGIIEPVSKSLGQILTVLSSFTGIKAPAEDSVEKTKPAKPTGLTEQDLSKTWFSDLATEGTLKSVVTAITTLAGVLKEKDEDKLKDQELMAKLSGSLESATNELKNAASGIAKHQMAQGKSTQAASARLLTKANYDRVREVALRSVEGITFDGQSGILQMEALEDGLIQVTGWVQTAENAWSQFTVKVNEAGEASKASIKENSKAAKRAAEEAKKIRDADQEDEEDNQVKYSPEVTYKRAFEYMKKLNKEGKQATLQFKDSGRYTVATKETVGGISKETFQTFDEEQREMSRTTVTLQNTVASAIRDTNNLILENTSKIANAGLLTQYTDEYSKLIAMNKQYEAMDNLSDDDITAWNNQISLVQRLGNEVSGLIKSYDKIADNKGVAESARSLDEYKRKAEEIFKEAGFGRLDASTPEQKKLLGVYDQILNKTDELKKRHAVLDDAQTSDLDTLLKSLRSQTDAYKKNQFDLPGAINEQLDNFKEFKNNIKNIGLLTDDLSASLANMRTELKGIETPEEFADWLTRWEQLKSDISAQQSSKATKDRLSSVQDSLSQRKTELSKSASKLGFDLYDEHLTSEQLAIAQEYKEAINLLELYRKNAGSMSQDEIANAFRVADAIQTKMTAYKDAAKAQENADKKSKEQDAFTKSKDGQVSKFDKYKVSLTSSVTLTKELSDELTSLETKLTNVSSAEGLDSWNKEFASFESKVHAYKNSDAFKIDSKESKDQLQGMLNALNQAYKAAKLTPGEGNTPEVNALIGDYEALTAVIKEHIAVGRMVGKDELGALEQIGQELLNNLRLRKEQNDLAEKQAKEQEKQAKKKPYGTGTLTGINAKDNALQRALAEDDVLSKASKTEGNALYDAVKKYEASRKAFQDVYDRLKTQTKVSDTDETEFKDASAQVNKNRKAIEDLVKAREKLYENSVDTAPLDDTFEDTMEGRAKALKDYVEAAHGGDAIIGKFNETCDQLEFTIRNSDGTFTKARATIDRYGKAIVENTKDLKVAEDQFGSITDVAKEFGQELMQFAATRFGIEEVFQMISQGVESVKELDLAMTELKKVTNETDATYDGFVGTASKTASKIGTTLTEFVNSTADFARLGYGIEEAASLAEAASIYSNIGDGVDDIDQATSSIISTMQAFGMEASDSMSIVDKFNEIGNRFAITSGGIGDALQRSASALNEAGNTIDESIALITTANAVVQNPESVGTALKTLALRLRGAKTELEEAGLETDNMAESTSTLQAKLKALTHGKVDIMLDADTFKSTTQILREMSTAWEDMTDIERASALELMGGKRQANILSAIISNWDEAEKAIQASADSAGSAVTENVKYMDSIQGRIDQFNNATQTMWANFISGDLIKGVVDFGTTFIKFLDQIGAGWTALLGTIAAVPIISAFKGLNKWFQDTTGTVKLLDMLKGSWKNLGESITNMGPKLTSIGGFFANLSPWTIAAVAGITALTVGITYFSKKAERATKKAEDALNTYENTQETLSKQKKTVEDLSVSYEKLSKGVDLETNENISLSTDAYQEYLDVCNEIADIYPHLVSGFDAQGNAILSLTGKAADLTAEYEAAAKASRATIVQDGDSIFDTFKENYDDYSLGIFDPTSGIKQKKEMAEEMLSAINTGDKDTMQDLYDKYLNLGSLDDFKDMLESAGIAYDDLVNWELFQGNVVDQDQWKKSAGLLTRFISSTVSSINEETSKVKTLLSAYLGDEEGYKSLNDQTRLLVDKIVSSLDADFIAGFDSAADLETWVVDNIVGAFTNGTIGKSLSNLINDTFDLQKDFQSGEMTFDEYQDKMSSFVTWIEKSSGLDEVVQDQILGMFDIDPKNEKSIGKNIDQMMQYASGIVDESAKKHLGQLSYDDLQLINSSAFKVPDDAKMSWAQLQAQIKETRIATTQDFTMANLTEYADSISAISTNISAYQTALENLEGGNFTMTDFVELIKQFPELADGVDISSKSFNGLSKNLRKAIKNSPEDLIDDLKDLRKRLEEAGKSTDVIDDLIDSLGNMPDDAFEGITDWGETIEEQFSAAKQAISELQKAMELNPNANFETRGSAIEQMKTLMEQGMIGSESELWDIASAFGFTYDSAKTINENADALYKYISARETWYATDKDGNYTYDGTESFIETVDKAAQGKKWEEALAKQGLTTADFTWDYKDGKLNFDFDNANYDKIVAALSEMPGLVGLTSAEFADLLVQIGQFHEIDWENADDVRTHMNNIANGTGTATEKIDNMTSTVERYAEKVLGMDLDMDNLDLTKLTKPDDMAMEEWTSLLKLLGEYKIKRQELSKEDSLGIVGAMDKNKQGLEGLYEIDEIVSSLSRDENGMVIVDEAAMRSTLKTLGYTEEGIENVMQKVQQYQILAERTPDDPLGIKGAHASVENVAAALDSLGASYQTVTNELGQTELKINMPSLVNTLAGQGWTSDQISSYITSLTSSENTVPIALEAEMTSEEIDAAVQAAAEKGIKAKVDMETTEADAWFNEEKTVKAKVELNTDGEDIEPDGSTDGDGENLGLGMGTVLMGGAVAAGVALGNTAAGVLTDAADTITDVGVDAVDTATDLLSDQEKVKLDIPDGGIPLDIPDSGVPVDIPESGLPIDVPDNGLKVDIPESGVPLDLPDNGLPMDIPENGLALDIPDGGIQIDVPESGLKVDIPENGIKMDIPDGGIPLEISESGLPLDLPVEGVPIDVPVNGIPIEIPEGGLKLQVEEGQLDVKVPEGGLEIQYPDGAQQIECVCSCGDNTSSPNGQTENTSESEDFGNRISDAANNAAHSVMEAGTSIAEAGAAAVSAVGDAVNGFADGIKNQIDSWFSDGPDNRAGGGGETRGGGTGGSNTTYTTPQDNSASYDIDAKINYTIGTQEEPEDLEAKVNYTLGTQAAPEDKSAIITYTPIEGGEEDSFDKEATVTYDASMNPWTPPKQTGDVVYTASMQPFTPPTLYGTIIYTAEGGGLGGVNGNAHFGGGTSRGGGGGRDFVDGNAHAQGTAYKSGSWGADESSTSLVGELGPELRVRGNQWTLLGERGAEFADVRKGDIIFNHKQTESLLANGYVTGRGKAYAEGNAFASGSGTFTKYTFKDTSGSEIKNSAEKLSQAAKDMSEASEDFKEVFDWIEVRIEEITEDLDLLAAQLENAVGSSKQNAIIDDMINVNRDLYNNLIAGAEKYAEYAAELLKEVPEEYREAAQDGSIAIESFTGEAGEKTLEAIENYREWVQKGAEVTQQAEEVLTEISSLAKQAIDNIASDYENKVSIPNIKLEQFEAYNELSETTLGAESGKIYKAMIKVNENSIATLEEQRDAMQAELNKRVESGEIKKYSQDWYDAIGAIAEVDNEILGLTADTEDYQDAMNELHWDHFDNLIGRLEAISDEADNLIDILGSDDLVDKDTAEWTDEGIATLGLYAQQLENAEAQASKYAEEIRYLNNNWQKLGYTEQEYVEKLEELKNGQYDAIKAYEDTKDSIVDLNKERVEAIKEGIQKEIDAYQELIEAKKEELDAEKDLYDFQKNIADQQKNIADIERKLAALSSDNSASARAQRAKLQAELAEAQQELQDTYYDRSISDQQDALDKELEAFQEEKDKEIEGWEEYLTETEQVVADSLATVQANTDLVYNTLESMGQEYSLSITEALTSPWAEGKNAIQDYSEQFGLSMSSTVEELRKVAAEYKEIITEIEGYGKEVIGEVNDNVSTYQGAKKKTNKSSSGGGSDKSSTAGLVSALSGNIQYGDSGSNVKKLQRALNELGYGNSGTSSVDGIFGTNTQKAVQAFQKAMGISADGIVGPETKKKFKAKGYAKGTTGTKKDELAWIDEMGLEELVLHAGPNGKLQYLTKGTSIIPSDISENLMSIGQLDPQAFLDQNRPTIGVSPEVHNTEVNITMEIAEVVHIDKMEKDTLPDLTKAIDKQLDKYMKGLNAQIRRYANR